MKNRNKYTKFFLSLSSAFIVFSLIFPLSIYATSSDYIWSTLSKDTIETSSTISSENTDDTSNPLGLDCGSCILIEQTTRSSVIFL